MLQKHSKFLLKGQLNKEQTIKKVVFHLSMSKLHIKRIMLVAFVLNALNCCTTEATIITLQDIDFIERKVELYSAKTLTNIEVLREAESKILADNTLHFARAIYLHAINEKMNTNFETLFDIGLKNAFSSNEKIPERDVEFVLFVWMSKYDASDQDFSKRFAIYLTRTHPNIHQETVDTCDTLEYKGFCKYKILDKDWVITYTIRPFPKDIDM